MKYETKDRLQTLAVVLAIAGIIVALTYGLVYAKRTDDRNQFAVWKQLHPETTLTLRQFVVARDAHFLPGVNYLPESR